MDECAKITIPGGKLEVKFVPDSFPIPKPRICNHCGKVITGLELACNSAEIKYRFGYGSKYDGDILKISLCDKCLDDVADELIAGCKIGPIAETN